MRLLTRILDARVVALMLVVLVSPKALGNDPTSGLEKVLDESLSVEERLGALAGYGQEMTWSERDELVPLVLDTDQSIELRVAATRYAVPTDRVQRAVFDMGRKFDQDGEGDQAVKAWSQIQQNSLHQDALLFGAYDSVSRISYLKKETTAFFIEIAKSGRTEEARQYAQRYVPEQQKEAVDSAVATLANPKVDPEVLVDALQAVYNGASATTFLTNGTPLFRHESATVAERAMRLASNLRYNSSLPPEVQSDVAQLLVEVASDTNFDTGRRRLAVILTPKFDGNLTVKLLPLLSSPDAPPELVSGVLSALIDGGAHQWRVGLMPEERVALRNRVEEVLTQHPELSSSVEQVLQALDRSGMIEPD